MTKFLGYEVNEKFKHRILITFLLISLIILRIFYKYNLFPREFIIKLMLGILFLIPLEILFYHVGKKENIKRSISSLGTGIIIAGAILFGEALFIPDFIGLKKFIFSLILIGVGGMIILLGDYFPTKKP